MTARTHIALVTSLAAGLLGACDSDMDPGSLVERARVLGAEAHVQGAPERAAPAPGETVSVRLLMAWPGEEPALDWRLFACLAPDDDAPPCLGGAIAMRSGTSTAPAFDFVVPDADALGDSTSLTVLGVVCEDGTPELSDDLSVGCRGDGAKATQLEVELPLAVGGFDNAHPNLADDALTLDDASWNADEFEAAAEGCASDDTDEPRITADGETHAIVLRLSGEDREEVDGALETLQISSFTTAGELSTQYSFVESSDTREHPELELEWDAPAAADVPEDGLRVRFVWVARDMRGGLSSTTRTVCVTR